MRESCRTLTPRLKPPSDHQAPPTPGGIHVAHLGRWEGAESLAFVGSWDGESFYGSVGTRHRSQAALINSEDNHRRGSGEAIVRSVSERLRNYPRR